MGMKGQKEKYANSQYTSVFITEACVKGARMWYIVFQK